MSRRVPNHVGFILDGNRRWAVEQGIPSLEGHKVGYETLETIALSCFDKGIDYVSAYIFSVENWNRSKEEVGYLMDLVLRIATKDLDRMIKKGVKVNFIGSKDRLSNKIIKAIDKAEYKSRDNTKGVLVLCFNYGGNQEIVDATKKIIRSGISVDEITIEKFEENLYSPEIPSIDLVIRTSGEMRLSNFMLWRSSYSELYFCDVLWPAFTKDDLETALSEYNNRQRRFGK